MSKKVFSIPGLIVSFIIFAVVGFALAGLTPQEFGHTADEVDFIALEKSIPCTGTSCEVKCDPGYAVFAGACTSTDSGKWNLYGARADHEYWDCVDGSANSTTSTITAEATCVKTYFDNSGYSPSCGNYIVDNDLGEVCDGPNILDIDCEDYVLGTGTQLCNGTIGACSSSCDGLNISLCEYCDPGVCTVPGEIECEYGSCAQVCGPGTGGPKQSSGVPLDDPVVPDPSGGWYFPPGPPLPPPPVGPGPGIPICGDGVVNGTDQCEPPGQSDPSCPGFCMQCPPGSGPFIMFYGMCSDTCQCIAPSCGDPQGPLICTGPGPPLDPGTIDP